MRSAYTSRILRIIAALLVFGLAGLLFIGGYLRYRTRRYERLAEKAGLTHGVDPVLITAVMKRESKFRPRAAGKAGETGLMQVTKAAAKEWAEATGAGSFITEDLFQPEINIEVGTWYLARAVRYWSNKADPLPYALAEYNAGRSNATRWSADDDNDPEKFRAAITYPSTRLYIKNVLDDYNARTGADSN